jgi:hypothetical protein
VWNEAAGNPVVELDMFIGPSPVAIDIYGNRRPLQRSAGKQQLVVTQSPQFIDGIDMRLARLRAGFRLDPEFVVSTHARHEHALTLANPYPRTIAGRVHITGPERWDIQPRIHNFSIPAGQQVKLPVSFSFPINEIAGPKQMTAQMELEADERYTLDLSAPLTVGLQNVHLQANATIEAGAGDGDVVVTLLVSNTGDADQSFYAFALAPGAARQERIISPLKAGQSTIKRFRFPAAAVTLSGQEIRVGLRQTDGPAVLNHVVQAP